MQFKLEQSPKKLAVIREMDESPDPYQSKLKFRPQLRATSDSTKTNNSTNLYDPQFLDRSNDDILK